MKIDLTSLSRNFSNVEFFVACFSPKSQPEFQGASNDILVINSSKFWAISSIAPSSRAGLVHGIDDSFLIFRGYEVSVGVHTYSPVSELAKISSADRLTNGAFAFLKFDPATQSATIRNDAFGISPIYYREINGTWFFASHPGLIYLAEDSPDLISWASMIENGYIFDNRSFYKEIKRFPSGTEMSISPSRCETRQWFDFSKLPDGEAAIDDEALDAIENAYRTAMARCLKLEVGQIRLPFTSGFDSRRYFALLVRNKIDFKTVTCQSFHRKNGHDYEIDSTYAPKIAAHFGVASEVLPAASHEQSHDDFLKRQRLIGTETLMHNWAMPLMRWLSTQPPSLVFDGLAGDVFGNSSFDIEGLEGSPRRSAADIVDKATKFGVIEHLSLPTGFKEECKEKYREFVDKFPANMNQSQLAFFQARTRRAVSPWITMMHPPGHVVVFPYCDVDFAATALKYDPGQKYKRYLQRECLQRFYPEFYDFEGSRKLPASHSPVDAKVSKARDLAERKSIYGDWSTIFAAARYLRLPNKILLLASRLFPSVLQSRDWIFRPLLTILHTQRNSFSYINPGSSAEKKQPRRRSAPLDTKQPEAEQNKA